MLIIPAIEIHDGRSVRTILGDEAENAGIYSDDPVQMALLWRRENAKTLHILDRNGLYGGELGNRDAILAVIDAVEIPVQLVGRCSDVEECESWLDAGVYRLFIHDLVQLDPEGVRHLIQRYGASRVCVAVITREGRLSSTWRALKEVDAAEYLAEACELGITRTFFTDRNYEGILRGPNFEQLRRLSKGLSMRITAAGGIATVEHLWMLQEMESLGIDSVVIGRAFYENSFPCQRLWRDIEIERRKKGESPNLPVSTSPLLDTDPTLPPENPPEA